MSSANGDPSAIGSGTSTSQHTTIMSKFLHLKKIMMVDLIFTNCEHAI